MNARMLLILSVSTLCACGSTVHENNFNNGIHKNLSFDPLPAVSAMGGSFGIYVYQKPVSTSECARTFDHDLFPHRRVSPPCQRTDGPEVKISAVLSADCGAACATALPASAFDPIVVTPLVEGDTTLNVVVLLADGTTSEDSIPLTFAKFDPISVKCLEAFKCPGPNAVFVGARIDWRVRSMVSATKEATLSEVEVTEVTPAGVVAVEAVGGKVQLTALTPGVATIHFRDRTAGRNYETTRQVRVVGVDEVIRGEARLRTGAPEADGLFRADADLVGAAVPDPVDSEAPQLILTWLLADGARAIGGAGRVTSHTGQVVVPGHGLATGDDVDHAIFYFNGLPGPVELTALLGNANLSLAFSYTFKAEVPPCRPLLKGSIDLVGKPRVTTQATVPVWLSRTQPLEFAFVDAPPDVVLVQICGEARALIGPQSNDFTVTFPTDGVYAFAMKNLAGQVLGVPIEIEVLE